MAESPANAPGFHELEAVITELERSRRELQESYDAIVQSRRHFREILDKMSDSVCVQRDGVVVWGNREFLRQLGCTSVDEVVGLDIVRDIVHPDDRHVLLRTIGVSPEVAHTTLRRFRVVRRDGTSLDIEISAPQIVDFDGAPARIVVGRDITERLRQESAMLVADRMASIGLLAAGVAHEIANPLAYAIGSLAIARRALEASEAPKALRDVIDAAIDGTDRVRRIVRELQSLGRGDVQVDETVDVAALVESTLALARRSIEDRTRVTVDVSAAPRVRGDRARLSQVLLNLVLNAADAIEPDAPERNEIAIFATRDEGGRVVLAVRDTGSGIPADVMSRIFDPFFTTKPVGKGTGLGLAICQRIVSDLGGTLTVESTPGRGSTFRLVLRGEPE
jgi:PAS domain S-box-containing protein